MSDRIVSNSGLHSTVLYLAHNLLFVLCTTAQSHSVQASTNSPNLLFFSMNTKFLGSSQRFCPIKKWLYSIKYLSWWQTILCRLNYHNTVLFSFFFILRVLLYCLFSLLATGWFLYILVVWLLGFSIGTVVVTIVMMPSIGYVMLSTIM